MPSDSDCGCDGELDLWETEPIVEAGEGGARPSDRPPGTELGRLSNVGAFNRDFSFSLLLIPFRLYHLSFPTPLLFGDAGSTEGLAEILEVTSGLLRWGVETLAGDDTLPEGGAFAEDVEADSCRDLLSLL